MSVTCLPTKEKRDDGWPVLAIVFSCSACGHTYETGVNERANSMYQWVDLHSSDSHIKRYTGNEAGT